MYIFSRCELAYLQEYCAISLYARQDISIHSNKINYGSDIYINNLEFGGIKHLTYNYTDEEWLEYLKEGSAY